MTVHEGLRRRPTGTKASGADLSGTKASGADLSGTAAT
ncbi:MAG: pentapeptide repeat-containing protein [Mycobacteriales bacterium]